MLRNPTPTSFRLTATEHALLADLARYLHASRRIERPNRVDAIRWLMLNFNEETVAVPTDDSHLNGLLERARSEARR